MRTDSAIQKDVMDELKWEPILNPSELGVAVKNGIVTIVGIVDTYFKKVTAANAAKRVIGVKDVMEDIEVVIPPVNKISDTDIAMSVLIALKNSASKGGKITIKVEDGWITMEGEVEWDFQKRAIQDIVYNMAGICGISNLIKVRPKFTPKDIKQKISFSFERNAIIDTSKINVESIGNKVILTGSVNSFAEKESAEKSAYRAPGVSHVENRLQIETNFYILSN